MRRTVVLFSASLLVLTACSPTNKGNPLPSGGTASQTSSSSSADEVPGPGVPKVANAIDIASFKQAPCNSLTAAQVNELLGAGATPKPDPNALAGPSCSWDSPAINGAHISVIYSKVTNLGLTGYYRAKGTAYPFFRELSAIDGYPIIAYDGVGDRTAKGACDVAFGTSDRETVAVAIQQSQENTGKKDACESGRGVAAIVLGNLRGVK